jgi:hypothetical protein
MLELLSRKSGLRGNNDDESSKSKEWDEKTGWNPRTERREVEGNGVVKKLCTDRQAQ